jgi:hypothetical protein
MPEFKETLMWENKSVKRYAVEYGVLTDKTYRTFVVDGITSFRDHLTEKGINITSLKQDEKEKVFLAWKWGSNDSHCYHAAESTERECMGMRITPEYIAGCDETSREFWKRRIMFEERCNEIRVSIGLNAHYIAASGKKYVQPEIISMDEAERRYG